ncbi:MAG TPA: bifunctional allantoicase/(S)-ureidoglycine aminohydrolase [Solirubrobacteraceae bacterium]
MTSYYVPRGGLPGQTELASDRTRFTTSYALICKRTMRDIVTSRLPFWEETRLWVLARPLSGFAETFSQYIVEVAPGGGSDHPETDSNAEAVLFAIDGTVAVTIEGATHELAPGGYAYIPPGAAWTLRNRTSDLASFHWIRKAYQRVEGLDAPDPVIADERAIEAVGMPDTDGAWATTLFVDPADLRHDMHVTIVTLQPGASIPFAETHVMEHGLYVLQGTAVYLLNQDWLEVEAGDFMWLRAFCPQACTAAGPEPFRYLLYKDVNRHAPLPGGYSAEQK